MKLLFLAVFCLFSIDLMAADLSLPGVDITLSDADDKTKIATALKILLTLTVLSVAPAILIAMTSFTRIIIVLSILRHALGMQHTPPNTVLISLALLLTVFSMLPSFKDIQTQAFDPYMNNELSIQEALDQALQPLRGFMIPQTREQDLALMLELEGGEQPDSMQDVSTLLLVPAFMLSELKTAFQIGFIIFLPFLLIDIIVASILMSMGMLMVPPMMISLPIKVMVFVLIDGWNLVVYSLMGSFL